MANTAVQLQARRRAKGWAKGTGAPADPLINGRNSVSPRSPVAALLHPPLRVDRRSRWTPPNLLIQTVGQPCGDLRPLGDKVVLFLRASCDVVELGRNAHRADQLPLRCADGAHPHAG